MAGSSSTASVAAEFRDRRLQSGKEIRLRERPLQLAKEVAGLVLIHVATGQQRAHVIQILATTGEHLHDNEVGGMGNRHLHTLDCHARGAGERERFQSRSGNHEVDLHAAGVDERQDRTPVEEFIGEVGIAVAQPLRGQRVDEFAQSAIVRSEP